MPDVLTSPIIKGCCGQNVIQLQAALARGGYFDGDIDGSFGAATSIAIQRLQAQAGLPSTGEFTAAEQAELTWPPPPEFTCPEPIVEAATSLFAAPVKANVAANLPAIWHWLSLAGCQDRTMLAMALATIRVETASFLPVSELRSPFNSSSAGTFDLYDDKPGLGNLGAPDGATYRGRGFIQLTGRANYAHMSALCGLGDELVRDPYLAHDSAMAARILVEFLKSRASRIRTALTHNDLSEARKAVNGGTHGLATFTQTYQAALEALVVVMPA